MIRGLQTHYAHSGMVGAEFGGSTGVQNGGMRWLEEDLKESATLYDWPALSAFFQFPGSFDIVRRTTVSVYVVKSLRIMKRAEHLLYHSSDLVKVLLPHPFLLLRLSFEISISPTHIGYTTPAPSTPGRVRWPSNPPAPFSSFLFAVPIPFTPLPWSSPSQAFCASPSTPLPR